MKYDDTQAHRAFALPGSALRYGPDKTVDVEHIDLHLQPDLDLKELDGVCTMTVRALDEDVRALALDAVDLTVRSVVRDGRELHFTQRNGVLTVTFERPISPDERATFAITYRVAHPRFGVFFIEPTFEYPEKIRHAWTQSQDENARYWFPCLDYPHEKQTSTTTIVVRKGLFALANGELVERRDEEDRTVFRYRQDVPHSTYLMSFVVGPFVEVEQKGASVPVSYYVLPGREADGERSFGKTPKMLDFFERRLGMPYPYARYSQIAVGDFIFGGMENTTATTQTDRTLHDERAHLDFSSDPLVAHELAHQWFGDLLTCRDWAHAWLNEGFATYFEASFREEDLGYDEYLYDIFGCVAEYLEEDGERYRRPIVCNRFRDPIELFDRHLYQKGASVLHMLRGELGAPRFWRALSRYVADNAKRSVETIDLIRAIEVSTGRNMRGFFDQWIFRGGHPKLTVEMKWDARSGSATVTIDQTQQCDDDQPPFRFSIDLGFVQDPPMTLVPNYGAWPVNQEKRVRVTIERQRETITVPLEFEPKLVRFDPGAFILADVTYAFGADFASAALRTDPDPVARIRAARELAKDASLAARDALAHAFADEPFWGVLVQMAAALGDTHAPWARELLLATFGHKHPKVRRAIAAALGAFKDARTAVALERFGADDDSYFVRAAALESLGKTRMPRAFETLRDAIRAHASWNGTVEAGAARGLAELADARAAELLIEACALGKEEGLRRAAVGALGRLGELVESERARVVATIADHLDDQAYLVALAAIASAERLGDARLLDALERVGKTAIDGRQRRSALEAAMRIREAQKVPAQVSGLRTDLDTLREEQRKLQEQIEALARA